MTRTDRTSAARDELLQAEPSDASSINVAVLPEPGETSNRPDASHPASRGDADELIAKLADKQIDALMSDGQIDTPTAEARDEDADAATEMALQAASEFDAIAGDLSRNTAALVEHEVNEAASKLREPTPDHSQASITDTPAPSTNTVEVESVSDAPAAAPPSFDPPRQADVDRDQAADSPAVHASEAALAEDAAESSAEAVARELAADAALTPSSRQPVEAEQPALPSGVWWRVALRYLASVPRLILAMVNLPVQSLTNGGREAIGAVAIVTLVNAAGLLLYLKIFAK